MSFFSIVWWTRCSTLENWRSKSLPSGKGGDELEAEYLDVEVLRRVLNLGE
jgi:hypothetical protein